MEHYDIYDELYLYAYYIEEPDHRCKHIHYCLQSNDPDDLENCSEINYMIKEIILKAFSELTFISYITKQVTSTYRTGIFKKHTETTTYNQTLTEKLIHLIDSGKYDCKYCVHEYTSTDKNIFKNLYIMGENLSSDLWDNIIQKTDITGYESYEYNLIGYAKEQNVTFDCFEEYVNDFNVNFIDNVAIYVCANYFFNGIYISINPYLYSVQNFVEIIKQVAEKYDMKLLIQI